MVTEVTTKDFKERSNTVISIEIAGKKYHLKPYSINQEIRMKKKWGTLEAFNDGLNNGDPEILLNSLFMMLDEQDDFETAEDVGELLSGDPIEKLNIQTALWTCIMAAQPDIQEALKKSIQDAKMKVVGAIRSSQTGLGSITASPKNMGGQKKKSKN